MVRGVVIERCYGEGAQAHHQLEDDDADDDGAEGEREFQGSSAV